MSNDRIVRSVSKLIEKHEVTHPPVRVEAIAEAENVDVVFVEFSGDASDKIHGFYDSGESKIYVNIADSVEEKQFTIAHELGHHILHQEYSKSAGYVPRLKLHVKSTEEAEADAFATELLLPKSFARGYNELFSAEEMQQMFLVTSHTLEKAKL